MNNFLRACILLIFLASCKTHPAVLNPSNLPSQIVEINTSKDTTIQLAGGTELVIPANAFSGTTVKLEIKEAVLHIQH